MPRSSAPRCPPTCSGYQCKRLQRCRLSSHTGKGQSGWLSIADELALPPNPQPPTKPTQPPTSPASTRHNPESRWPAACSTCATRSGCWDHFGNLGFLQMSPNLSSAASSAFGLGKGRERGGRNSKRLNPRIDGFARRAAGCIPSMAERTCAFGPDLFPRA